MQLQCSQLHLPQSHLLSNQLINTSPTQNNNSHQKDQIILQKVNIQNFQNPPQQHFAQRLKCIKTQQYQRKQQLTQYQNQGNYKLQDRIQVNKFTQSTYRPGLIKSIHNSNQLILVYLMYKQQKLSLFLNKGVSFQFLLKKMYKQIYIYQKQTYSISNAILKNLLYKITGFQSIDNDIIYDYQLKYKRGNLIKQKFFVPFKQEDYKTPFKIYSTISANLYGGNQFLARSYSDGQWITITSIKKGFLDEDRINSIKKSLKNNFLGCSILLKSCASSFSQINWLETKHYLMILSQCTFFNKIDFPQNLQQNLKKNKQTYTETQKYQIFIYYAKWLAYVFKQMIISNIQIFKKLSLNHIELNPSDGLPKISIYDNVVNCVDFSQRRRSLIQNGKRISQKINDSFYYETYLNIIKSLQSYLQQNSNIAKYIQDYINFIEDKTNQNNFTFEIVYKYFSFDDPTATWGIFQRQKEKHVLKVDFSSKLQKIIENMTIVKNNSSLSNEQTLLISQMKEQVQRLISTQNMRKNQQRNQNKTILQMLSTSTSLADFKKQNIGNVTEFKKQEDRKYNLKTKQKNYIQEILNELNQNQNFIKTTKQNNLASIQFYLKKSDQKIKKKIVEKISTKYKKFFQRKQTNFDDDAFTGNISHMSMQRQGVIDLSQDICIEKKIHLQDHQSERNSSGLHHSQECNKLKILPLCSKNSKAMLNTSKVSVENKNPHMKTIMMQKQNFSTYILSRIGQRNSTSKISCNSLKKKKTSEPLSPVLTKKKSKLEQLFVNSRDYSKQQKLVLKKKQYGIYLQEAQNQYNKIRIYRKNTTGNPSK